LTRARRLIRNRDEICFLLLCYLPIFRDKLSVHLQGARNSWIHCPLKMGYV
jgi:hypothetical protein